MKIVSDPSFWLPLCNWRELFFCQLTCNKHSDEPGPQSVLDPRIVRLRVKLPPPRSWDSGRVQDNLEDKGGELGPHENS